LTMMLGAARDSARANGIGDLLSRAVVIKTM